MNEKVDYTKVLDDLIAEREKLDAMIGWVKAKLGQNGAESNAPTLQFTKAEPVRFPRLAADAFFKMTVSDAIKEYLRIVRRPQTARDITDALKAGGLAFKAKNLYQTVFPTLGRMAEAKEVDKLTDGTWGLTEWYSGARRASSAAASASASEETDS